LTLFCSLAIGNGKRLAPKHTLRSPDAEFELNVTYTRKKLQQSCQQYGSPWKW